MIQVKKEVKKLNRGQRLVVKTLSSTSNKDEEKKNFP
jgi:TusA-related sulfurtransferase